MLAKMVGLCKNIYRDQFSKYFGDILDAQILAELTSLNTPTLKDIVISGEKAVNFSRKYMQNVPFDLHLARIKELKLNVPLTKLYDESVKVDTSQVYIVLKFKENYTFEQYQKSYEQQSVKQNPVPENYAQKEKGFFDGLINNVLNKMQINIDDLAIQIQESTNLFWLVKAKQIKKKIKDQSVSPHIQSSIDSSVSASQYCLDASIGMASTKTHEQTISIEVQSLSAHICNSSQQLYANIDSKLNFPFQWPKIECPSTILVIDGIEGLFQTSRSKKQQELTKLTQIKFLTTIQIQLEPYQIKLLQRLADHIEIWNAKIQEYHHLMNIPPNYEVSIKVSSEIFYDAISIEDSLEASQNFYQLEQIFHTSNDEEFIYKSMINLNSQKNNSLKQSIVNHNENELNFKIIKIQDIRISKAKVVLFKESKEPHQSQNISYEYQRKWKNNKDFGYQASCFIFKLNKFNLKNQIVNEIQNKLNVNIGGITIKSLQQILQQPQNIKQASSLFVSADEEQCLTPAFNKIGRTYVLHLIVPQMKTKHHYCKSLIFSISNPNPNPSLKRNHPKNILEYLAKNNFMTRYEEIKEEFQLKKCGDGFSQTKLSQTIKNDKTLKPCLESLFKKELAQQTIIEVEPKNIIINIPTIQLEFSLDTLVQMYQIMSPYYKMLKFTYLIPPLQVPQKKHQEIHASKPITNDIKIEVGLIRCVLATQKFKSYVSDYVQSEQLCIQNQEKTLQRCCLFCHLDNEKQQEPFGLIFELDQLNINLIPKHLQLKATFNFLDLLHYEAKEDEVKCSRLVTIQPLIQAQKVKKPDLLIKLEKIPSKNARDQFQRQISQLYKFDKNQQEPDQQYLKSQNFSKMIQEIQFDNQMFQNKYDAKYQEYNTSHNQQLKSSFVMTHIQIRAPQIALDSELRVVQESNKFLMVFLLQLENVDLTNRTLQKQYAYVISQEQQVEPQPSTNNFLNDCKNNMMIHLESDEVVVRDRNFFIGMWDVIACTSINMNSQMNEQHKKRDQITINVSTCVRSILMMDPQQIEQCRDSMLLRFEKPDQCRALSVYQLLDVNSVSLPSYYQWCVLAHSDTAIPDQSNANLPFLIMEFEFMKIEHTNLKTSKKKIKKTMDLRSLSIRYLNLRTGDGMLRFQNSFQTNDNQPDEIDEALLRRDAQIKQHSVIEENLFVSDLRIDNVTLAIHTLYSQDNFYGANFKDRFLVNTVNSRTTFKAFKLKDLDALFYADTFNVLTIDQLKLRFFTEKILDLAQNQLVCSSGVDLKIWDIKALSLHDRSIYVNYGANEQEYQQKHSKFPYLLFVKPTPSNVCKQFKDSFLDFLGYDELIDISTIQFTMSNYQDLIKQKQMQYHKADIASININAAIEDLEGHIQSINYIAKMPFLKKQQINNLLFISKSVQSEQNKQQQQQQQQQQQIFKQYEEQKEEQKEEKDLRQLYEEIEKEHDHTIDDDDCVILMTEDQQWNWRNLEVEYEQIWNKHPSDIKLMMIRFSLGSINLRLQKQSHFQFETNVRKYSDYNIMENESKLQGDFKDNIIGDYLQEGKYLQELVSKLPQKNYLRVRKSIRDKDKIITLTFDQMDVIFNKVHRLSISDDLISLQNIRFDLKDIKFRLFDTCSSQEIIEAKHEESLLIIQTDIGEGQTKQVYQLIMLIVLK